MSYKTENPIDKAPDGMPIWGRNAAGKPICYSQIRKQPGKRCRVTVGLDRENGRCPIHGGPTPSGFENPNIGNGTGSKYGGILNGRFRELYEQGRLDPNYTSLRDDIAVAGARVAILLQDLRDLDGDAYKRLVKVASEAREFLAGEYELEDAEPFLIDLIAAVTEVERTHTGGLELERAQDHLRKMINTENRRISSQRDAMSATQVWTLFLVLANSVFVHLKEFWFYLREYYPEAVKDPRRPRLQDAIVDDISKFIPRELLTKVKASSKALPERTQDDETGT